MGTDLASAAAGNPHAIRSPFSPEVPYGPHSVLYVKKDISTEMNIHS